jgi:hypothetical protein
MVVARIPSAASAGGPSGRCLGCGWQNPEAGEGIDAERDSGGQKIFNALDQVGYAF